MDMDQLAQELEMLKNESMAAKEEKRMGGFIDKYGTKFNGNTDIANLILAEMDRRGVNEASEAASEAVQAVLDKLREEATMILDETKGAMQQVSDLVDKINDIQESVDAASSGSETPPAEAGGEAMPTPPDLGAAPAGDVAPPPDMGAEPPMEGGDMGGAPPDMGAAEPAMPPMPAAPEGGAAPPPPPPDIDAGGAVPPEGEIPPPAGIPSDVRLKNIRSKFAAYKQSRSSAVPSDKTIKKVWKPQKDTLSALRGLL